MTALAVAALTFTGVAALGLTACAQRVAAPAVPVAITTTTVAAPAPATVIIPPPATVYVVPPETVTAPAAPKAAQTSCQWLRANGYSYTLMRSVWMQEGFPINWDADRDGYPCEQSYGNQN